MTQVSKQLLGLSEIRRAVADLEARLGEFKRALDIIVETAELAPGKNGIVSQRHLEMEIAGVTIPVGPKQGAVLRMLTEVEGDKCVPRAALATVLGGGAESTVTATIKRLRDKLTLYKVPAAIVSYYNDGYRLEERPS